MVLEQRMEGVVADPGLVPEHVVAEVPDLLQHLAHVVDRAVVGRELDAGEPERALGLVPLLVLDQRVGADLLAQVLLVPGLPVDRADHAEGVARGRQEDRDRAGLHQRALVQGLVVVAVEQHQVAPPQHRVGDDLVGGAGAVQDEVGPVGAEHLGGVALRVGGRALVDQQIAEVDVGIAQVVAEDALAEVLEEELARRRLAVELAALVARAVEGDVGLAVIGHEPAEERRQQAHAVLHEAGDDLLGVEGRGLLAEVDVAVDLAQSRRQRPGRRSGANRPAPRAACGIRWREPHAASLRAASQALAVDQRDVGADGGILGHVAVEAVGRPRPRSAAAVIWSSSSLVWRFAAVDDRDHLQQLVERDRDGRRLDVAGNHSPAPSFTQSTR